jgi:voltage-gated potassium channel Kch
MYLFRVVLGFFKDRTYRNLSISTLLVLANGTIVYHFVEGWRWLDSLYFSVITLTTVGYGDLSPQTDFGKIFTIIYILTGIGIIFGFINTFYLHRRSRLKDFKEKRDRKKTNLMK